MGCNDERSNPVMSKSEANETTYTGTVTQIMPFAKVREVKVKQNDLC